MLANAGCLYVRASRAARTANRLQPEGGVPMGTRTVVFAAALLASGSALAFHCPADMKKIDDALAKNPQLTAAQMDEVKKDRAEGEALHKAGKHQESLDALAKAEKILNIQ
jgi:hypothetical protein